MRFFRKKRNDATSNYVATKESQTVTSFPKPLLEPATMMESDVSTTSTSSGLNEILILPNRGPSLIRFRKKDQEWNDILDTTQTQTEVIVPMQKISRDDPPKRGKGSMKRLISFGMFKMGPMNDEDSVAMTTIAPKPSSQSVGIVSTTRPVLITITDGVDDLIGLDLVNPSQTPNTRTRRESSRDLDAGVLFQQSRISDLTATPESKLSAHFRFSRQPHDEDDSLFADDTAEMSFVTGTSYDTGRSQSTGFSSSTGFSLSTSGTNETESVFTELTGNIESQTIGLGAISDDESSTQEPTRRVQKKGLAKAIADDFVGIFLDVVRGGNDLLSCAVDNSCIGIGEECSENTVGAPLPKTRRNKR